MTETEEGTQPEYSEPDQLRPVPVITLLDDWVDMAQKEVSKNSWHKTGKTRYGALAIIVTQLEAHAMDFPNRLDEFHETEEKLNLRYGGDPATRGYQLYYKEVVERLKNALALARNIGPMKIDSRYVNARAFDPDTVDLSGFEDDKRR